jgi:hypothetical protein
VTRSTGPRRHKSVHSRICDKLAHMLIGMDNDTEIDSVDSGVAALNLNFAFEVARLQIRARRFYRFQGTLDESDDFRLLVTFFPIPSDTSAGILTPVALRRKKLASAMCT